MTLIPSDEYGIRGHPGNKYDVNEICAHPACGRRSAHAHHLWPRSHLRGQPYDWVRLPDGTVMGNRLGFCVEHHNDVTGMIGGHKARILWVDGILEWFDRNPDKLGAVALQDATVNAWILLGPLTTQPPVAGNGFPAVPDGTTHAHAHIEGEMCPLCGHHKTPERATPRPGKTGPPVKKWVAAGDREGAELLDEHVENFAIPLGMSDWSLMQKRYHVTSIVYAWVEQHREEFIADVAEAAERRLAS